LITDQISNLPSPSPSPNPPPIIIEGGSLFYLNLFLSELLNPSAQTIDLTSNHDIYRQKAISLLQKHKHKPWEDRLKVLKDYCQSFDIESGEIEVNDEYRLEKALGWALGSGGLRYKRERG
jgi:tRNA A37 N6-isopentenylltransferase MiaA